MLRNTRDNLDRKILSTVGEYPGIRLSELSKKLDRDLMTVRYRILEMALMGDLEVERAHGFKVYPADAVAEQ